MQMFAELLLQSACAELSNRRLVRKMKVKGSYVLYGP